MEVLEKTLEGDNKPLFFGSDNFAANMDMTKQYLKEIIRRRIKLSACAQIRVEATKDEEFLVLAKEAGIDTFILGFESMNPDTLKKWNKKATPEDNRNAVRQLHKHGFSVHGMFIFGSDYDTLKDCYDILDFAQSEYIETAQFFGLIPLPGTPMTRIMEKEGKILSKQWNLYDGQHALIQPNNMTGSELQYAINDVNFKYYSKKSAFRYLFKAPANRWRGFTIKYYGSILAKRMMADSLLSHQESLNQLDEWKARINDVYQTWFNNTKKLLAEKVESLELQKKMSGLYDNTNTMLMDFKSNASNLIDRYKTHITPVVDEKIIQLKEQYAKFLEQINKPGPGLALQPIR
jgi:radical SAM superfamily enzyme YgiQ (UPF0313 family)